MNVRVWYFISRRTCNYVRRSFWTKITMKAVPLRFGEIRYNLITNSLNGPKLKGGGHQLWNAVIRLAMCTAAKCTFAAPNNGWSQVKSFWPFCSWRSTRFTKLNIQSWKSVDILPISHDLTMLPNQSTYYSVRRICNERVQTEPPTA